MLDRAARLLNLRSGDSRFTLALLVVLALNTVVLELSDVVATAGFVSNLGAREIPRLWVADMLVTFVVATGLALAIDRLPRLQLLTWLTAGLAVVYLFMQLLFALGAPDAITYPTLYILADQQFMLFPLAFWTLVNDLFTVSESKRLIPLIATGAAIGSIGGNLLASAVAVLIARRGGNAELAFSLSAILLLVSLGVLRLGLRGRTVRARQDRSQETSVREILRVGKEYFNQLPLLRYLSIALLLGGLTLTFIEFNLLLSMQNQLGGSLSFQAFYGLYKTALVVALILLQSLVTGRMLARIELKNAFPVLPAVLLAASGMAIAVPGLLGAATARFAARLAERAWDEPVRKTTLNLVPDERRGRVSTLFDTFVYTAATLIGALILVLLDNMERAGWFGPSVMTVTYLIIAVLSAGGALTAAFAARAFYDRSLLSWRLSRPRRKSALDGIEF